MNVQSSKNISRIVAILSLAVISTGVIVMPLGYFFITFVNMSAGIEAEADINAKIISRIISTNPEMWEYEYMRLQEFLTSRPSKGSPEKRRILNLKGKLVAENPDILESPTIMRTAHLYDSGEIAGKVEIYRSLRPVIVQTAVIFLFMLPLGAGAFLILWYFPIRMLYKGERSLHESEESYRKLSREFRTVLDCIYDPLFQLNHHLAILWANRGALTSLREEGTDLKGEYCHALWHDRSVPCEQCPALKSFKTGMPEELQISNTNGRLLHERAFPVKDESGEIRSIVVIANDITEKTNLQAEMMRAGHLASLGELAAGIAHEINNPINGVINYAQMIADRMEAGSWEQDVAGRIIKEGSRVAEIVRGLLSFAREKKDEKISVRISDVLSETLNLTITQIFKDSIYLKMDVPDHLPNIIANPQQLQQVFLNILNNARYALNQKYTAQNDNKKIEIHGETIIIHEELYIRLTFFDSGTGIPGEVLYKVINPFFTTKPAGSGTGLGLSISYGIIKDHGGRLDIESRNGEFTRVIIVLPVSGGGAIS